MAKDKKVEQITARDEDFAKWYTDIVKKANLVEYSSIKGFMIFKPRGYAIWENIRNLLDAKFKACGVSNVYLPMLIPESLLNKEKDHVEGFAPEVAWVTQGGSEELTERLCVRPTSETLFCDFYKNDVQSYRDLPKLYNQWCSVIRWEKTTRPFLRSCEFLWQEGHTVHATEEEGRSFTRKIHNECYISLIQEDLAIPVISGMKTDKERFAGARETYTCEAMMHDGKALQSATSHFFGDGFAKAFDVTYLDKDNTLKHVFQTSWGASTRLIGAIIMVHGDDNGLVLPPRIAPTQATIVPIRMENESVMAACEDVLERLKAVGVRINADFSDKTPGWKFAESEMVGTPIRIEIGPKDVENKTCVIVRRFDGEKISVGLSELDTRVPQILEEIQKAMFERAKAHMESHIYEAQNYEEFCNIIEKKPGFVKAMWCGERECEDKIKTDTTASSRCIIEGETMGDTCVCCGKKAHKLVYWGKAY